MFKILKNLPAIKPIASKSFLDALDEIKDIEHLSEEINENRKNSAESYFSQAIELFTEIKKDKKISIDKYKKVTDLFLKSLEYKINPEAYVYLALIFYTLGDIHNSENYLRNAQNLNYSNPMVKKLQDFIKDEEKQKNDQINQLFTKADSIELRVRFEDIYF